MSTVDGLGYLASLLVLAAFCMRGMVTLRLVAMASNLAFIGYAMAAGIHPVLVLHAILLPVNAWRLGQAARSRRRECEAARRASKGDRPASRRPAARQRTIRTRRVGRVRRATPGRPAPCARCRDFHRRTTAH